MKDDPSLILAIDCGSTTSKARLFEKTLSGYRYTCSGEAPTTVEAPYEDVTLGVRNAIREIEETKGISVLSTDRIIHRESNDQPGVDVFVSTSSGRRIADDGSRRHEEHNG